MKAHEPSDIGQRRGDDQRPARRLPRRTTHGPIGFGHVLQSARRSKRAANGVTSQADPSLAPRHPAHGTCPAPNNTTVQTSGAAQLHQSFIDPSLLTGSAPSNAAISTTEPAGDARTAMMHARDLAQAEQSNATQRVTPERAMQLIADVASEMGGASGAREIRLELEPQHLGPLIVTLVVDRGRIRADLKTRRADAAEALESGREGLARRLEQLGFSSATVSVAQDETI